MPVPWSLKSCFALVDEIAFVRHIIRYRANVFMTIQNVFIDLRPNGDPE